MNWNSPDPWIAIGVTVLVFSGLQMRRRLPIDLIFMGALVAVTITGVITPAQALKNFSNPAVITIAGLLIVAAGLKSTGVLDWLGQLLLGRIKDEGKALRRIALVLATTSAFVLNTALVAMTVPVIVDWCRRRNISPSRLLIPVSYFAILGGVCSLIGTSTTLIVNGLLRQQYADAQVVMDTANPQRNLLVSESERFEEDPERYRSFSQLARPLGLFEIAKVGLPLALVGSLVLIYVAPKLLPDRKDVADDFDERRREYLVEMRVEPTCRLVGKSVEEAGLRNLQGLFLIEISRSDETITPVTPIDTLRANDRLAFSGVVSQIMDLEKIPGLVPIIETAEEDETQPEANMVEAVLSRTSPLIGHTVRESNFRQTYDAAVVAVHRNGARLPSKIGDISLEAGDTLLLQTRSNFIQKYRNSVHFYLVSDVDGYEPPNHRQAAWAIALGLLLIGSLILCTLEPFQSVPLFGSSEAPAILAVLAACAMILTRCVSITVARSSLDMQVLLAIVGALGLGEALRVSGAASGLANLLVDTVGDNQYLLLVVVYLTAMLFTELITNNAVATILLPIAISIAWRGGYNPQPFIMAVAVAASLSFLTPVGYQTNLMVLGPGGYMPRDYLKIGTPVAATVTVSALLLIPQIWPF